LSGVVPVSDTNSAVNFLTGTFVDLLPARQVIQYDLRLYTEVT